MKTAFSRLLLLLLGFALISGHGLADDMDRLTGKWTTERKTPDGDAIKMSLEIKAGKFKYRITDASGTLRLYAEGSVKIEKHGPFQTLRFGDIRGGQNETELSEVNDDRVNPYQLGYDTLTMAGNLDRERDESPRIDVYKKVAEEKKEGKK